MVKEIQIQEYWKMSDSSLEKIWMTARNSRLLVRMDWSKQMLWVNLGTIFFCTSRPNQLFCWEVGLLATRRADCF
jgi:hypothetical protein